VGASKLGCDGVSRDIKRRYCRTSVAQRPPRRCPIISACEVVSVVATEIHAEIYDITCTTITADPAIAHSARPFPAHTDGVSGRATMPPKILPGASLPGKPPGPASTSGSATPSIRAQAKKDKAATAGGGGGGAGAGGGADLSGANKEVVRAVLASPLTVPW
jgi:hypothetical protein